MTYDFRKGALFMHTVMRVRCRCIRFVKSRNVVTVEILEGPRAGQWYDANPVLLAAA